MKMEKKEFKEKWEKATKIQEGTNLIKKLDLPQLVQLRDCLTESKQWIDLTGRDNFLLSAVKIELKWKLEEEAK